MNIVEVMHEAGYRKRFRRKCWTHPDVIYVRGNKESPRGGELIWQYAGTRATLCYARDLVAEDWETVPENFPEA